MKNRYGGDYGFKQVGENTYLFEADMRYGRYGGREGQNAFDPNDIGFVDPPGGPLIAVGSEIEGRIVKRIRQDGDDNIFFDVAPLGD